MIDEPQQVDAAGLRPLRRTDLTVHELDGEALVYDPLTAGTHRLNGTARFIWGQCDGLQDARRIAKRMTEVYNVSMSEALEHTERIFNEFQSRQIVNTIDGYQCA